MAGRSISTTSVARGTILNLSGQVVPLFAGIALVPSTIAGLGVERFGLLSLVWLVLGYLVVFDFGLGRATTKHVAEILGKSELHRLSTVVWTSIVLQALFGTLAALLLIVGTDRLVGIIKIPPHLLGEAKLAFSIVAWIVPVMLLSSAFSGILEAQYRFDLVNLVRVPSNTLMFVIPWVGAISGYNLTHIVLGILILRVAGLGVFAALAIKSLPPLRSVKIAFDEAPQLLKFGGWVMIGGLITPFLLQLERVLISALDGVGVLAYYTAPYEVVTRLWIFPVSLMMTIFPAFSTLASRSDWRAISEIYSVSFKYIFLILGMVVVGLGIYAKEIILLWLGPEFAASSSVVFQILLVGILFHALGHIPYSLFQGVGKPDIPTKLYALELPPYIVVAWYLIDNYSILGAAFAWSARVALETLFLLFFAVRAGFVSQRWWKQARVLEIGILLLILALLGSLITIIGSSDLVLWVKGALLITELTVFVTVGWNVVLTAAERVAICKRFRQWRYLRRPNDV